MGTCVVRKDFQRHKTEKRAKNRPRQRQRQRELLKRATPRSGEEARMGDDGPTGRRQEGSSSPSPGEDEPSRLPTAEASRSSEVSPPHDVTNPSGVISLHTPPSPKNYPHHLPSARLRQLSEDPQSGCDHRQGRRPCRVRQSRLLAPSLHTCTTPPYPHPALASRLPGFQGPLLCSLCDCGTLTRVSPRHTPLVSPPSVAPPPGAPR